MHEKWLHQMDPEGRTPLDRAFDSGHMALAELMLRQEKDDQSESLAQSTPLHRAACLGLGDAVRSLMQYGADPTAADAQGETPLHKAVRLGHEPTVWLLVARSDVNARSNQGMTPLHWACATGNVELASVLTRYGADPHLKNDAIDGLSPMDMALEMGYDELAEVMQARGTYA